jgi:hypothetical protein
MTDKKLNPYFLFFIPVDQVEFKELERISDNRNPIYTLYQSYPKIERHVNRLWTLGQDYNNVTVEWSSIEGEDLGDGMCELQLVVKIKSRGRGNKIKNLESFIKDQRVLDSWSEFNSFLNDNIKEELEDSMESNLSYE